MSSEKIVVATGVFDLLHLGHLHFLEQAKAKGSKLTVIVARDSTVEKLKNRTPIHNENERLELIRSLKIVDNAVIGKNYFEDKFEILKEINPNIFVIGFNQKIDENKIKTELKEKGFKIEVIRLKKLAGKYSTKEIIKRAKGS